MNSAGNALRGAPPRAVCQSVRHLLRAGWHWLWHRSVDQACRLAWRGLPRVGNEWWLIDKRLGIETSLNPGALFGMGAGWWWLFALLSVIALAGIMTWAVLVSRGRGSLDHRRFGLCQRRHPGQSLRPVGFRQVARRATRLCPQRARLDSFRLARNQAANLQPLAQFQHCRQPASDGRDHAGGFMRWCGRRRMAKAARGRQQPLASKLETASTEYSVLSTSIMPLRFNRSHEANRCGWQT